MNVRVLNGGLQPKTVGQSESLIAMPVQPSEYGRIKEIRAVPKMNGIASALWVKQTKKIWEKSK